MSEKKTIVDQVIKEAKKKKSGTGEYGKWILYNIKFAQDNKKYSWFAKETDIIPLPGMKAIVVDYIEEQNGDYTNYTIKKLQIDNSDSIINSDTPNSQANNYKNSEYKSDISWYVSYAKDIFISQLPYNKKLQEADFKNVCESVAYRGLQMFKIALKGKLPTQSKSKAKPEPKLKEEALYPPAPDDDDLPF